MVRGQLTKALDNADLVYADLVVIAEDIIKPYLWEIDSLIQVATTQDNLSNDDIRSLMFKLAMKSYSFSEIKEKSSLKAECAEALRKEKYAKKFNESDGTVAFKENQATIEITDEILAETVYELVADLFKTKLNEVHSIMEVLKVILTTRIAEAKLSQGVIE